MERNDIEKIVRGVYERRTANDAAGMSRYFPPDAMYRVAAEPGGGDDIRTYRGDEIRLAFAALCETFPATEFSAISLLIDGNHTAARVRASVVFKPTGEALTTELAHFRTFGDAVSVEVIEYFDTGHVARLMANAAGG